MQVEVASKAVAEAGAAGEAAPTTYSSGGGSSQSSSSSSAPAANEGTLASDEALAALREKLTGGA
jgi:small subunit ribosomal protein S1